MSRITRTTLTLLLLMITMGGLQAQKATNPEIILQKMQLANNYFMEKWPDVGKTIVTNRERPSNIWTRAVYYEGLMPLYSIDHDQKYYK